MYRKAVFSLVAVVSLSAPLSAAAHSTLRGEVTSESPIRFQDLSIELQSPAGIPERTALSMDGKFEFREVEMGQYRLRVVTLHGDSIREEYINVSSGYETLTIRLRGNESSTPSKGLSTSSSRSSCATAVTAWCTCTWSSSCRLSPRALRDAAVWS